jgi:hypothetical protein
VRQIYVYSLNKKPQLTGGRPFHEFIAYPGRFNNRIS